MNILEGRQVHRNGAFKCSLSVMFKHTNCFKYNKSSMQAPQLAINNLCWFVLCRCLLSDLCHLQTMQDSMLVNTNTHAHTHSNHHDQTKLVAQNLQATSYNQYNQTKSFFLKHAYSTRINKARDSPETQLWTCTCQHKLTHSSARTDIYTCIKHVTQTAHAKLHAYIHTTDHNVQASEEIY